MEKYITGQRKVLMDYLKSHSDRYLSVEEIAEGIGSDRTISKSAVYRNIDILVREGALEKSAAEGSRRFLYRYVDNDACLSHLHMKCLTCGSVYHMDDKETQMILRAVARDSSFRIDGKKTMLYGVCEKCN